MAIKELLRNASSTNANPRGMQSACPTGWHCASLSEWDQMFDFLIDEAYGIDATNVWKIYSSDSLWMNSPTANHVGNNRL